MRRKSVSSKFKSARSFNRRLHRTKKPNMFRGVMRGGYRF